MWAVAHDQHSGPLEVQSPAAARAEQAEALEQFFRRYAPYVAKIGHRLLGRDDEVDDLVQDVFLAAHEGIRSLRDVDAIKGWLATVAVRKCRRRLRARKVRVFLRIDAESDYNEVADSAATPEQRAMLAAVYRTLDSLPANQRIAWSLRYIEGEKLERVATLCGCSLATVKRRIKTAHDTIKREQGGGSE